MTPSRITRVVGLSWLSITHVITLAGFGLIGLGVILPWADTYLPVKVYVLGMESGLERIWVQRLFVIAGIGLLLEVINIRTGGWRIVLCVTVLVIGVVIALITVLTSPLSSNWVPELGVYITLLGSIVVILGSGLNLVMLSTHTRWTRPVQDG